MDYKTKRIVAWHISKDQKENILLTPLKSFLKNKKSQSVILSHSDNGSQYTSRNYINLCKENEIIHSYSNPGTPHHNKRHERWHVTLKNEILRSYNIKSINEYIKLVEKWIH